MSLILIYFNVIFAHHRFVKQLARARAKVNGRFSVVGFQQCHRNEQGRSTILRSWREFCSARRRVRPDRRCVTAGERLQENVLPRPRMEVRRPAGTKIFIRLLKFLLNYYELFFRS